jgi:hypothetical protein
MMLPMSCFHFLEKLDRFEGFQIDGVGGSRESLTACLRETEIYMCCYLFESRELEERKELIEAKGLVLFGCIFCMKEQGEICFCLCATTRLRTERIERI